MIFPRRLRKVFLALVVVLFVGTVGSRFAFAGPFAEWVRTYVVREATATLRRTVTITRVGGDPLRGVVLEGLHVAGPAGAPGTFFDAPRLVARFRLPVLVRDVLIGHGVLGSIAAVEVDRPFLALSIDAQGQWNSTDLFAQPQGVAVPAFTGTIVVREGIVVFRDASATLARPFTAHFERITGTLNFAHAPQMRIAADAVNTDGETPALLHVAGTAGLDDGTFDLDLTTRGASVAHWSSYLAPLQPLVWHAGTVDGSLHLLVSKWGLDTTLDYRGRLMMRHGRAALLPQKTAFAEISGPLVVDTSSIATDGLTMTVDTSPVFVRGDVGFASGVAVDLLVRSTSLDLATLQRLVFPQARLHVSGAVQGEARIVGTSDALEVTGAILDGAGTIAHQPFANLSTGFQYAGGLLEFDDLAATTAGGQVRGAFRMDLDGGTFFALADAIGIDAQVLPTLGIESGPTLQGRFSGFLAAGGKPGAVIAQGRVRMGPGSAFGSTVDAAESLFWYDRGGIELDRFLARSGPSQLHATGEVTRTGQLALDVVATNLDLQTAGRQFGVANWVSGTADLTGSLTGSLDSPVLAGELEARRGTLGLLPFALARGDVRLTTTGFSTSLMTLRDGSGRYQAAGTVQWDAAPHVDLIVQASGVPAQQLMDVAKLPLRVEGTVQGTLRVFGEGSNLQAEGSITLRDGSVEGQQLDRVQATFQLSKSGLLLERALAEVDGSTVEAQGTIGRNGVVAISFAARAFSLQTLTVLNTDFLRATGTVDLTGTMRGTVALPTVSAQLTSTSLTLNGQAFDAASGSAGYQNGQLTLNPLVLQQGSGQFRLSGSLDFRRDPVVNLQASIQGTELTTLLALARVASPVPLRGRVDGTFTASGALSNPTARLNFQLAGGGLGDHVLREALARVELANHALTLQAFSIKPEQGELVGAGRINLRGTSDVEFSGRGLALDILRPLFGLKRPLGGDLDFTLQASGTLGDPQVGISTTVTKGGVGEARFDQLVAQIFYRDGLLHIEQGLLQEGRHKVKAEGTVPFDPARLRFDEARAMDLRLFLADANLSVLGLFSDQVERAEGPLEGEVRLSGSVAHPRMVGSLTAVDGTIKIRNLDPPLTAVQARLTFNEDEIQVAQLAARLGEGTVTVGGTVGIREFRPDRLDLQFAVKGARLSYVPFFAGAVDSDLRLSGSAPAPRLSGTLTLSQGDLFVSMAGQAPGGPEPTGVNVALDVDLNAGDALWVNAGSLRAQVHGTMHAGGTQQRPRLAGAMSADSGTFTAFNSTFTLLEGDATFAEFMGTTALLDARAQTRVGTTTVFVQIHGPSDKPLPLLLSSDPPLSERQIVALLAGQAGITQLRGDQEGAFRLEFSQALLGSVGIAVGRALGFEEFAIQYDSTQPLQLRVGRLVVTDVYLTFSETFTTPLPYYNWSLDYHLTPATMVSFSVDNASQYSLLYRYTIRF